MTVAGALFGGRRYNELPVVHNFSTGRGMASMILNLLKNLVFIAVFAYLLAISLGWGEPGVWWGIVACNILGGLVSFAWARLYVSRLDRCRESRQEPALD